MYVFSKNSYQWFIRFEIMNLIENNLKATADLKSFILKRLKFDDNKLRRKKFISFKLNVISTYHECSAFKPIYKKEKICRAKIANEKNNSKTTTYAFFFRYLYNLQKVKQIYKCTPLL